jgi:hypothetical protein
MAENNTDRGDVAELLAAYSTNRGESLLSMTHRTPTLLVFLRHFGCTFCREAAADISAKRLEIERRGVELCFVYMPGHDADASAPQIETGERKARRFFDRFGLGDVARIADPTHRLYRCFDLSRGTIGQLLGPRVWARGVAAGLLKGHLVGGLVGDGFQMPGVFLLHDGRVVRAYRHEHAGSVPDYCAIAEA